MAELTNVGTVYGTALYQAACELGKKELILEEAKELIKLLKKEEELFAFLNTPVVSGVEKKEVVKNVFEQKISEELLNLLFVMIDKGRTRHLERAVKVYKELFDREEGFSYGKICSVKPLSAEQLKKFEEETGKLLKQNVKLENEVDTHLIGGVKILIDGKVIDASIRRRLDDLSITML